MCVGNAIGRKHVGESGMHNFVELEKKFEKNGRFSAEISQIHEIMQEIAERQNKSAKIRLCKKLRENRENLTTTSPSPFRGFGFRLESQKGKISCS